MKVNWRARIPYIALSVLFALCCFGGIVGAAGEAAPEVETTVLEDFEDADRVAAWAQVAGATFVQNTDHHYNGNASGLLSIVTNNGLTGSMNLLSNVSLNGYETLRFYAKNPGAGTFQVLVQIYLTNYQQTGGQPYVAIVNIEPSETFAAYDIALKDMTHKISGETLSKEADWTILELDFASPAPGLYQLYVDDITAVAPEKAPESSSQPESSAPEEQEGAKLVWDMEDKAIIDSLVTVDAQKSDFSQNTEYKRSGSASLFWKNSGGSYGVLGNMTKFVGVDLTGYDAIRLYVYNKTDYPITMRVQFCGASGTAYLRDMEVPVSKGFTPVDFDLDDFELMAGHSGPAKFTDNTDPAEWVIKDIGFVFTGRLRSEEMYIDDITLVTDEWRQAHANDPVQPVDPGESSDPKDDPASDPKDDPKDDPKPPETGVPFGWAALIVGAVGATAMGATLWADKRRKQEAAQ